MCVKNRDDEKCVSDTFIRAIGEGTVSVESATIAAPSSSPVQLFPHATRGIIVADLSLSAASPTVGSSVTRRRKRLFPPQSQVVGQSPNGILSTPFLQAFADHTKPSCVRLAAAGGNCRRAPEVSSGNAASAELSRAAHTLSRQHN